MPAVTNATILNQVKRRFTRSDSTVEADFNTYFDQYIRTICSEFPYWFLRVEPGKEFPASFPFTTTTLAAWVRPLGRWLDRGWLYVDDTDDTYNMAAPAVVGLGDQDAGFWSYVPIQRINSVKEFDLQGNFERDLEVIHGSRALSQKNYTREGQPQTVFWETGQDADFNEFSWMTFNPKPDQPRVYQVDFHLAYPIDFLPDEEEPTEYSNAFFQNYPEIATILGLRYYAEWYNDLRLLEKFEQRLHGHPQGATVEQREGLIGGMKKDTERRKDVGTFSVPLYIGGRRATGAHSENGPWKGRHSYYQRNY